MSVDIKDRSGKKVDMSQILDSLDKSEAKVVSIMRKLDSQAKRREDSNNMRRSSATSRARRRNPEDMHNLFNAPDVGSKDINNKAEKLIRQTEIIQVRC